MYSHNPEHHKPSVNTVHKLERYVLALLLSTFVEFQYPEKPRSEWYLDKTQPIINWDKISSWMLSYIQKKRD
jgi:hypothetical protein